jgi:hypothetical protein
MGIDYEFNNFDKYDYDTFFPNLFESKKEKVITNKLKSKKVTENNAPKMKNLSPSENISEKPEISKSRKSTLDNDETETDENKLLFKQEKEIKNSFIESVNSPFFTSKKELNLINNEYSLVINDEDIIRKSYYSKLIYKNIWTPDKKSKTHNSLFIFDWDDTLFPTTFLINEGIIEKDNLSEELRNNFNMLEDIIINILNFALSKGDVYIITNSSIVWFKYTFYKYFTNLKNIINKINIISARDEYEDIYPGENKTWKEKAFLSLRKNININLVTNIICFGDSEFELEAGKLLASRINESFVKRIKFKKNPGIEDLIKQLNLISNKIDYIYSRAKNLSITIEQKY